MNYLEWANSAEGVETAIRLANHIIKKYQGHNWYSNNYENGRIMRPEILSITYLSMLKVLPHYDPKRGSIKTFLWTAVPREVYREVKKELVSYEQYEDYMEVENKPIDMLKLIETLPEPRRDRFRMHLEGYTYQEIKEEHNISKSMVYKDISLAKEQLRKEIDYEEIFG